MDKPLTQYSQHPLADRQSLVWLRARIFVTSLLLCVVATGCATLGNFSDSIFLISPQEEIKVGDSLEPQIEKELQLVEDPALNAYVTEVGERIWRASPRSDIPVEYHVVKDDAINAFALIGGSVYVNTGLIKVADDEAELAGVIAHEVGHVVSRHGARKLSRHNALQAAQTIALGSDAGPALELLTTLVQSGALNTYSRDFERESDRIAVGTLHRAGYDPSALRTFFAKLQEKYGDTGRVASFFSSHPATQERMDNVDALVDSLPPANYERPVNDLRRAQARIAQLGY